VNGIYGVVKNIRSFVSSTKCTSCGYLSSCYSNWNPAFTNWHSSVRCKSSDKSGLIQASCYVTVLSSSRLALKMNY